MIKISEKNLRKLLELCLLYDYNKDINKEVIDTLMALAKVYSIQEDCIGNCITPGKPLNNAQMPTGIDL